MWVVVRAAHAGQRGRGAPGNATLPAAPSKQPVVCREARMHEQLRLLHGRGAWSACRQLEGGCELLGRSCGLVMCTSARATF
jgi:hypothetical protein